MVHDDASRNDYFANHGRARRFPWTLYHAPLERDLARFLAAVAVRAPTGPVLVIGGGLLHEIDRAPRGLTFVVVDIDQRAIAAVRARQHPQVVGTHVIQAGQTLAETLATELGQGAFAAAYAKEVIEHIVTWPAWLLEIHACLRTDGALWLSTPNYGEPWLPTLEATVLEWVARRNGFSRRHLHPARFSARSLADGLRAAAFDRVESRVIMPRLAVVATGRRRG